jgi:undecaprenyl-diphosphatase
MTGQLLLRLSARDRSLMLRCAISPSTPRVRRAGWTIITHLGGAGPSLLAAVGPLFACCALHEAAKLAAVTVVISHLIVQVIKRSVVRARPATVAGPINLIAEPDRFSFPSGHAAASMSVALIYSVAFPGVAVPLLFLALLVGFSRVRLGVHYPSDVLAGQLLAAMTASAVMVVG